MLPLDDTVLINELFAQHGWPKLKGIGNPLTVPEEKEVVLSQLDTLNLECRVSDAEQTCYNVFDRGQKATLVVEFGPAEQTTVLTLHVRYYP